VRDICCEMGYPPILSDQAEEEGTPVEQDSTTSQAVVDQLVEAALPKLRALAVWLVEAGRDSDLRRLEREVIERGHDVLMGLLGGALDASPAAQWQPDRLCGGCGAVMGYLGKRPKWLHTSIGHPSAGARLLLLQGVPSHPRTARYSSRH